MGSLTSLIEKLWWRRDEPAWAEALLWPLSLAALAIRAGAALSAGAVETQRVNAKVISVGNLAVGGAGKTPVAMFLCEELRARGHKPAFLSRGYRRAVRTPMSIVCAGAGPLLNADEAGDEPLLVARRCPWLTVLVGADRVRLAREAERRGADVLVLDDGLQHRALERDLDVIVLDAKNPLGNRRRLPRGPLREGPELLAQVENRALIWLTNARTITDLSHANADPELRVLLDVALAHGALGPIESAALARPQPQMVGVPTFLLAGIARPERFEETVSLLGADIRGRAFFADHHRFTARELSAVQAAAKTAGALRIATTEKDFARLSGNAAAGELPIDPIAIDLEILQGRKLLDAALDALLGPAKGAVK